MKGNLAKLVVPSIYLYSLGVTKIRKLKKIKNQELSTNRVNISAIIRARGG